MAVETDIRPATVTATRVWRAALALGGFGVATAALVVVRLFESWRVAPAAASHHVTVFGLRLSYPEANIEAVVIVALATIGLLTLLLAIRGAVREYRLARRLDHWLASRRHERHDGSFVIADDRPQAFCAGLFRPRVYVSSAAVELLDPQALTAVLEHERQHARRHDPLRIAAGRVATASLFFVPGLRSLVRRASTLAELSADEHACAGSPADGSALARAMIAFDAHGTGIEPVRVDRLTGERAQWQFPAALFALAAGAIALLAAVAVLAGRVASGSTSLGLPFLSGQPCVVVLAAIPVALALLWLRHARR
jgi:hypothetical protein